MKKAKFTIFEKNGKNIVVLGPNGSRFFIPAESFNMDNFNFPTTIFQTNIFQTNIFRRVYAVFGGFMLFWELNYFGIE